MKSVSSKLFYYLFEDEGRISRLPFNVYFWPLNFLFNLIFFILIRRPELIGQEGDYLWIIRILIALMFLLLVHSLFSKRLHDLNKSKYFLYLCFVPFISVLLVIYVAFFPGTKGVNKYGEDPRDLERIKTKKRVKELQKQLKLLRKKEKEKQKLRADKEKIESLKNEIRSYESNNLD